MMYLQILRATYDPTINGTIETRPRRFKQARFQTELHLAMQACVQHYKPPVLVVAHAAPQVRVAP